MDSVGHARMTSFSNGMLCKKKVLVLAKWIAESIKVNIVSATVFVNRVVLMLIALRGVRQCGLL